ncbi:MAG: twin-arginine translocation signal domain-containing protein, partial [Muribaculaceae bacterium]|nr:twin-arginine translocation signal domain-containing protein [Muribaculaceae bacterium]
MDNNKISLDRRSFIKRLGLGGMAAGATLAGCTPAAKKVAGDSHAVTEVPADRMTYRTNHNTGDRVSLLGYGMMRLPT